MRFLVTAGGTSEPIDGVRVWATVATGRTGRDIALALRRFGDVELLTSSRTDAREHDDFAAHYTTYEDLDSQLTERVKRGNYDAIVMSAAVGDYAPDAAYEVVHEHDAPNGDGSITWRVRPIRAAKIPSGVLRLAIAASPTPKLIDRIRRNWGFAGVLVKFKLEIDVSDERLIEIAEDARRHSRAELIVANTLAMAHGDGSGAFIIGGGSHEWVGRPDLAEALAERVVRLCGGDVHG